MSSHATHDSALAGVPLFKSDETAEKVGTEREVRGRGEEDILLSDLFDSILFNQ